MVRGGELLGERYGLTCANELKATRYGHIMPSAEHPFSAASWVYIT